MFILVPCMLVSQGHEERALEILRRFAAQNKRHIPDGTRLKGGRDDEAAAGFKDPEDGCSNGAKQSDGHGLKMHEQGDEADDGWNRHDVTVGQALRHRKLRNCFLALSFALCSLVLAYYGASFGLASFSGDNMMQILVSTVQCPFD